MSRHLAASNTRNAARSSRFWNVGDERSGSKGLLSGSMVCPEDEACAAFGVIAGEMFERSVALAAMKVRSMCQMPPSPYAFLQESITTFEHESSGRPCIRPPLSLPVWHSACRKVHRPDRFPAPSLSEKSRQSS